MADDVTPPPLPTGGAPSSNRGVMIVLSYLWLLALVPLLVEKDDKEVQWHAKHGIVLMLAEIVFWVAVTIVQLAIGTLLGCVVGLLSFVVLDCHRRAAHRRHRQGRQRRPADRARRVAVRRPALTAGAAERAQLVERIDA